MGRKVSLILVTVSALMMLGGKGDDPKKDKLVVIHTEFGDMTAILYDDTPEHKKNFLKLAGEGFYDSTTFHRIIQDFMIQGGDPNTRDDDPNNDGQGNPGYTLPAEFSDSHVHFKGTLAAARNNNPEKRSSGSQFYIVDGDQVEREQLVNATTVQNERRLTRKFQDMLREGNHPELLAYVLELQKQKDYRALEELVRENRDEVEKRYGPVEQRSYSEEQLRKYEELGGAPHLDWEYTVFGEVIDGLAVVDSIAAQKTGSRDRPAENIYMTVEVVEMKKKKITKLYGYEYPEIK